MKFKIDTAGTYYKTAEKKKLERLGFRFCPTTDPNREWLIKGTVEKEFSTLEELTAFVAEYGRICIDCSTILIYDDYIE